jgi:hypothetical protein
MALGKLKNIDNTERKFGADPWYWFLKVQAEGRGEGGEEYWLVTEAEALAFAERGTKNPEDNPPTRRGVFGRVANKKHRFGEDDEYIAVTVTAKDKPDALWLLTEADLEKLRRRVDANTEDIEANRESWLADLFD